MGSGSFFRSGSILAAACTLLTACAVVRPDPYIFDMAAGDRAFEAGRAREAAVAYDRAAHDTSRGLDQDEAMYRAGDAWQRAGDVDAALVRFDWLTEHGRPGGRGPRGAMEAVRIRLERGDVARAEHDVAELARRAPGSGPARRGVELVLMHRDERDPTGQASLAWIDALLPSVRGTDLEPSLLWQRARRLVSLGRNDDALATYERLVQFPYPLDNHLDDGTLAYAQLLERLNRPRDAIRVIDRTLARREVSLIVPGEYERPHFQDLQWMKARLLRDALDDPAGAADAFHVLYVRWRDSLLRDNALAEEVQLRERLGQHDRVCDLEETLARQFPCTRFGRHAAEQLPSCGRTPPRNADANCHPTHHRSEASSLPPSQ